MTTKLRSMMQAQTRHAAAAADLVGRAFRQAIWASSATMGRL